MGLGNVSIGSTYPEVSRDEMLSKLNKLKLFESQQGKSYFEEEAIKSFDSNYQCSNRDMLHVESFKIIRGYN